MLFGVCGGAEEILVCVCGFDIEIFGEGVVFIDRNCDIKEMYGLFGLFTCEFNSGMGTVKCIDKVSEFVLSVCPNHKNIVDEMPPYKRFVRGFLQGIRFKGAHEKVCIGWCHPCSHCCTLFL